MDTATATTSAPRSRPSPIDPWKVLISGRRTTEMGRLIATFLVAVEGRIDFPNGEALITIPHEVELEVVDRFVAKLQAAAHRANDARQAMATDAPTAACTGRVSGVRETDSRDSVASVGEGRG